MAALRLQTLSDQASLCAIAQEWDALVSTTSPRPLPLTHAWLNAWTKNFVDQGELRVACIYEDGRLLAIAPMIRRICRMRGLRVTCCSSMSNGATPFSGLILHPSLEGSRLIELIALLVDESSEDVLIFHRIPVQGAVYAALIEYLPKMSRRSAIRPSIRTPVIDANESWQKFLEKRSKKFRKGLRSKLNRFDRMGFQVTREEIDSRFHPSIDQMVSVSKHSWKAAIGTDLAADDRSREFLCDLIEAFGRDHGAVQLFIARDKDVPIAFELQLVLDGVVYPLRADFDARYEEYSPGAVVEAAALKWLFETVSAHRYYSCADNYRYLSHWTSISQGHADVEVYRRGVKPYLLYAVEHRLISLIKRVGRFTRVPPLRQMNMKQEEAK